MSLAGTLLVALVGGSAGSGLTLFGGLKLQARQHSFEHGRWVWQRMMDAAASFGAIAAGAQTVFTATSWELLYEDHARLTVQMGDEVKAIGKELVPVHLAFGSDSGVTAAAWRVSVAAGECSTRLFTFMNKVAESRPQAEWDAARDAYDRAATALSEARYQFAEAARAEAFVAGGTNAAQEAVLGGS